MIVESILQTHTRLDHLIQRTDYQGIDYETLEAMRTRLDGEINFLEYKLERIEKAMEKEAERLAEPANTDAWRAENE